jgi:predicted Zn-dependent peptidase
MVWHPRFDAEDLANEQEIVLEEIAMYEDDPQDRVFDVLGEAVFGDHPLGRPVIGRAEVVSGTSPGGLTAFHESHYVAEDIVIAAAGSLEHDAIVELARAIDVPAAGSRPATPGLPAQLDPQVRFLRKETEQYHLTIGAPGIPRDDDRRFALRVLDNILGATSSSRLFQEVRERRGLAYNVFSFQSLFQTTGLVGVYLGTRPDNVAPALQVVADELALVRREGFTADELERSKQNVKGRMVLSLESTAARMNRIGMATLNGLPVLSLDEAVDRIEAVSLDDLAALTDELLAPTRLSAAGIGTDEDVFREAIGPLLETVGV